MAPERVFLFRPRTIFVILAIILGVWVLLEVASIARQVLTWILIALFFALALNPLVELLRRHGIKSRGLATGAAYVLVLGAFAALGAFFVPIVVDQVNNFVKALPEYVASITSGEGRLGFLEREYQISERVQKSIGEGGATKLLGLSGAALSVTKGVLTIIVATVTIIFMTFFMILEGPAWMDRFYGLVPEGTQQRWRDVMHDIYRTVGGYVTGNLLISVIAGTTTTIVLLIAGVRYAVALGLLVAILDLIPLAGATLAAILVSAIAFIDSTPKGIAVAVFFLLYQQLENHVLQPLIYGRTVQLSPLAVLIAVLIGAELAGVLGALAAIPVAGTIQVLLRDWLKHRRAALLEPARASPPALE